jgi:predicted nuclease of predicted toxin-antitoxin system
VVWLRCGNSTPQQVEALLRRNAVLIAELIQNPALYYVEII